jgi:hypothetical protein
MGELCLFARTLFTLKVERVFFISTFKSQPHEVEKEKVTWEKVTRNKSFWSQS